MCASTTQRPGDSPGPDKWPKIRNRLQAKAVRPKIISPAERFSANPASTEHRVAQQPDSAFTATGARMGLVVDLGQVLEIEVGVDLRGRDVSVT